jgi:subtilisin family serine protease
VLTARVLRSVAATGLAAMAAVAVGNGVASAQSIGQQVRSDDIAALREIDVPAAWSLSKGNGVTVAVLDTGVEGSSPDLIHRATCRRICTEPT